jgi:hypothetical protein
MRNKFLTAALGIVLGLGVVAVAPTPAPAAPPTDPAAIAKLIDQLGSSEFEEREKAQKALDAIGAPALDALRKAAADPKAEPEVRMRAGRLVEIIEMRTVSNTVLAPRKIRLVYKETPLPEAVADFSKKTGYVITLHDPENKLQERKITLDTGEVPFWEAFDQFCAKAGLVETDMIRRVPIRRGPGLQPIQPLPQQQLPQAFQAQAGQAQAGQGQVIQVQVQVQPGAQIQPLPVNGPNAGVPIRPIDGTPGTIILQDGTPKALPTDASGPVRIRALDEQNIFGPAQANEYLITLQASPEPRLRLLSLQGVTITRAIDDQGQALMQAIAEVNPNQQPEQPNVRGGFQPVRGPRPPVMVADVRDHYVPVRLKQGMKASKSLKELTGVISAQVVGESKVVLSADNILKAAGKTFKGEDGYIKIIEVGKVGDDQISVRFEMQQPKDLIQAPLNPTIDGGPMQPPMPPQQIQPGLRRGGAMQWQQGLQVQNAQPAQAQAQVQIAQPVQAGPQTTIVARPVPINTTGNSIALLDEKGNALPMVNVRTNASRADGKGGVIVEQTMIFRTKGMDVPSKLVLSGSHTATVNIPFTLKNVPLN